MAKFVHGLMLGFVLASVMGITVMFLTSGSHRAMVKPVHMAVREMDDADFDGPTGDASLQTGAPEDAGVQRGRRNTEDADRDRADVSSSAATLVATLSARKAAGHFEPPVVEESKGDKAKHARWLEEARAESLKIQEKNYCPPLNPDVPDDVLLHVPGLNFRVNETLRKFEAAEQWASFDGECVTVSRKCTRVGYTPDTSKVPRVNVTYYPNSTKPRPPASVWPGRIRTSSRGPVVPKKECWRAYSPPGMQAALLRPEYVFVRCDGEERLAYHAQRRPVEARQDERRLNVMVVQLDAVSLPQYLRSMKGTQKALESLPRHTVFRFTRHHALGSNSLNNKFPLWGGTSALKKKQARWVFDDARDKHGYMTIYANNLCGTWDRLVKGPQISKRKHTVGSNEQFMSGSILSWIFTLKRTIDHLFSPRLWCFPRRLKPLPGTFCKGETTAARFLGNMGVCIGSRHNWDLVREFFTDAWTNLYARVPKLAVFTAWENHIEENYGSFWQDGAMVRWIKAWFVDTDIALNTFFVFNSDHGLHMGAYFKRDAGGGENKWPFMRMIVPNWWLKANPQAHAALIRAEHSLITHFDTHQTLKHLLGWPVLPDPSVSGHGRSLLRPGLNPHRTCEELGIEPVSCTCTKWKQIENKKSPRYKFMSEFAFNELVRHIPLPGTVCQNWTRADAEIKSVKFSRNVIAGKVVLAGKVRLQVGPYQLFEVELTMHDVKGHLGERTRLERPPLQVTSWDSRLTAPCRAALMGASEGEMQHCSCIV